MASKQSDNHINIDVQSLETELQTMTPDELFMPEGCCIFPVPTILSRHNPNAYTPNAFSIGPFFFEKFPLIKATQKIKLKYLNHLIKGRNWKDNDPRESRLGIITEAVNGVLEESRKCYAGSHNFPQTDKFTKIMILDGCFLVELFRKNAYRDREDLIEFDDPIFTMSCLLQYLYHDLILLENQIPWIVLQTLFDLTESSIDAKPLAQLVIEFFSNMFSATTPKIEDTNMISELNKDSKHILDLLRNSLIFTSNVPSNETQTWQPFRSATSLTEAGIKFSQAPKTNILEIQFQNGVLEIPPLLIQETTETVFRNLICLEQCCPNYKPIITSYAILMDRLIDTNKDMELLMKSGAIHNWLNIDDATKVFNKLYDDAYVKKNYYQPLSVTVDTYCKRRWPSWRAVLVHDYFRHPWALISVIAATMILILTFLQTLFTIIN